MVFVFDKDNANSPKKLSFLLLLFRNSRLLSINGESDLRPVGKEEISLKLMVAEEELFWIK